MTNDELMISCGFAAFISAVGYVFLRAKSYLSAGERDEAIVFDRMRREFETDRAFRDEVKAKVGMYELTHRGRTTYGQVIDSIDWSSRKPRTMKCVNCGAGDWLANGQCSYCRSPR